jgi:hypothetical protein
MIEPAETAGAQVAGAGNNGLVRENMPFSASLFGWPIQAYPLLKRPIGRNIYEQRAPKRFGMSIASAISAWPR